MRLLATYVAKFNFFTVVVNGMNAAITYYSYSEKERAWDKTDKKTALRS